MENKVDRNLFGKQGESDSPTSNNSKNTPGLSRPLKVLFAPVEIAHNSYHMQTGLREFGIEVDILNVNRNNHVQGHHNDAPVWILQGLKDDPINTVRQAARAYDLIYFQFGSTFLDMEYLGGPRLNHFYPDLDMIIEAGTPVAAAYWGSDIWDDVMFVSTRLASMGYNIEPGPESSRYKQARIDHMARKASFMLSVDCWSHLFPRMVNGETPIALENWPFQIKRFDGRKLKIAHMPSNRYKKNTDLILEVLENMEELGIAQKVLIENVPHDQVRLMLSQSDLFIDQMTLGFGKASVEAMALGVPSFARSDGPFPGQRGQAPVFTFRNKFELIGKIVQLHRNREPLKTASLQGRKYVERYHSIHNVARDLYNYIRQAVAGVPIPHLKTDPQIREAQFQTRFYEQALPILAQMGDLRRLLTTAVSGLKNGVSIDSCQRVLNEMERQGLIRVSGPQQAVTR